MFEILNDAMEGRGNHPWHAIINDLATALDEPWKHKKLFLKIVNWEGKVTLDETGELPHSKSPEGMLRFLAVQGLLKVFSSES